MRGAGQGGEAQSRSPGTQGQRLHAYAVACAEQAKAERRKAEAQARKDSAFSQRVAAGTADPLAEAKRAVAEGEMRLVGYSMMVPGIWFEPYGVECRPRAALLGQRIARAIFAANDVPTDREAERKVEANFASFGLRYNQALVADPAYRYRDVCRAAPPGYRPEWKPREIAPPPTDLGFRDLAPTDRPVDLGEAARHGTIASLTALAAARRYTLDAADIFGMTPLAWAIAYRRPEHAEALLAAGADPAGAPCARVTAPVSPIQVARTLHARKLLERMLPRLSEMRREPLADAPSADPNRPFAFPDLRDDFGTRRIRYRLAVDARGVSTACTVIESTGDPRLDRRVCAIARRIRWRPARDEFGEPIAGTVEDAIAFRSP